MSNGFRLTDEQVASIEGANPMNGAESDLAGTTR
jgi:hypothetical protein